MLRLFSLLMLLAAFNFLLCLPVAWVDDEPVTEEEFREELSLLPDSLEVMEKRHLALQSAIERKLLQQYAREEGITVNDEEVELLFIQEFYDHPLFTTEGEFDYAKYYQQKETSRIRIIFRKMKNDILIRKTRELISRKSSLSDEELLERYILENVSLDINYAEFALDDVSIPRQLSAEGARHYWQLHQDDFSLPPEFNLGYTLIPFAEFQNLAASAAQDSLAYPPNPDSLALSKAYEIREKLQQNLPINYPRLTTGYISAGEPAGIFTGGIIKNASLLTPGAISDPLITPDGYLLYWLIDYRQKEELNLDDIRNEVWKAYITDERFHSQESEFQRYFLSHLEEFKVPAIFIYRIELFQRESGREILLGEKRDPVIANLERYLFNLNYMSSVAKDNGLSVERRTIYMQRYHYQDKADELISKAVINGNSYGLITDEGREYFFALESFIPSYIPDFKDLTMTDYFNVEVENLYDEDDFQKFYLERKADFATPDSIAIAGVHYRQNPLLYDVLEDDIFAYFRENYSRFHHADAVKCRFLVCADWERARMAYDYLKNGLDFDLVSLGFQDFPYQIPDGIIEYKALPERVRKLLQGSPEYSQLYPLETDQGWLVIRKLVDLEQGYFQLDDVRLQIRDEIAAFRADSLAYSQARRIFNSTTYFSDCYVYADKSVIFEYPIQDIRNPFPALGSLASFRAELLQLWRNEKLSRIIQTDDGYAVIFMRQKVLSRESSFPEALPRIKEIFAADRQLGLAQKYVENIITDLKKGADPADLLYFLGGYRHIPNLGLNSRIPGFDQSRVLIEDMLKHNNDYYSPVFKIDSDRLMFYHINNISKISTTDFNLIKEDYRQKVINADYSAWLKDYRSKKHIRIEI